MNQHLGGSPRDHVLQRSAPQVVSAATGRWEPIVTEAQTDRFIQIMRVMDRRYGGLCRQALDGWVERKRRCGLTPELLGWSAGQTNDPAEMLQVMAFTSKLDDNGRRMEPAFSMLGVAADVIPEPNWSEDNIRMWLARFVLAMKDMAGLDTIVRGVRRKTMTWKPMQRLHDLIREGIYVQCQGEDNTILHSSVVWEQDLAGVAYWQMKTIRVPEVLSG